MRFYIPSNLQKDFSDSLEQLGTETVINMNPLNKVKVRLDQINYRTKDGKLTPAEVSFAEVTSGIRLGDYLQHKDETFIVNQLKRDQYPDCLEFNTETCNTKFTITRFQTVVMDNLGNIITPESDVDIVEDVCCSTLFSDFQFKSSNGSVGVVPENRLNVTCQFNSITKDIKIGDKFIWFDETFHIISIDRTKIDLSQEYGLLSFDCEKVVV